jgi:hypothetical protein
MVAPPLGSLARKNRPSALDAHNSANNEDAKCNNMAFSGATK